MQGFYPAPLFVGNSMIDRLRASFLSREMVWFGASVCSYGRQTVEFLLSGDGSYEFCAPLEKANEGVPT